MCVRTRARLRVFLCVEAKRQQQVIAQIEVRDRHICIHTHIHNIHAYIHTYIWTALTPTEKGMGAIIAEAQTSTSKYMHTHQYRILTHAYIHEGMHA